MLFIIKNAGFIVGAFLSGVRVSADSPLITRPVSWRTIAEAVTSLVILAAFIAGMASLLR